MKLFLAIVHCSINLLIIYYFADMLFKKRHNKYAAITAIILLCSSLLSIVNSFANPLYNSIASSTIAAMLVALSFKGKPLFLLCTGFTANAILICCEFIPIVFLSFIKSIDIYTVVKLTIGNISFSYISTVIFFIAIVLSKFVLTKLFKIEVRSEARLNLFLLPLPILSIVIMFFMFFVSSSGTMSEPLVITSALIVFSLILVNILIFASDMDIRKKYEYRKVISDLTLQSEMKKTLLKQQNEHILETNLLVHEFQHQLNTLQSLIAESVATTQTKNASLYIERALSDLPKFELYSHVQCEALRSILISANTECKRLGITFKTNILFGDFDFMEFSDICTLFSNLFENAIHACTILRNNNRSAKISVSINKYKNVVKIDITNDKENEILTENEIVQSTKPHKARHGIGLKNIKTVAEKYDGYFNIKYTETTFTADIAMCIYD